MIKGILIGLTCMLSFLAVHIAVFHFGRVKDNFKVITRIFYSICVMYFVLFLVVPGDIFVLSPADPARTVPFIKELSKYINLFTGFFLYVFLWLGYCQFYFIVDRSISVRFMIMVENAPGKKLTETEIVKDYPPISVYTRRLGHMLYGNYFTIDKDGAYHNSWKASLEAKLFKFMKDFLNLGVGG